MVVGVPLFNDRVAPRCTSATHLLLATVARGRISGLRVVPVEIDGVVALLEVARSHGLGTLVCGGIAVDDRTLVQSHGIDVIDNVACSASEVAAAIEAGTLRSGLGFKPTPQQRWVPPGAGGQGSVRPGDRLAADELNCLVCPDRVCLRGEPCASLPTGELATASPEAHRMLEAAADISLERDRRLCRVAELVFLCQESGLARVGIAFCIDLLEATQVLASVLGRFVEVVPVCCKIGGRPLPDLVTGEPAEGLVGVTAVACNPLLQAQLLNEAGTDLNVIVGLCIGVDCVFSRASQAPVTTLFVKDRSLANNPIGAVYSEYYLRECAASGHSHGLGKSQVRARGRPGSVHLAGEDS
jgi:uncharacterized metal-binding protein